MLLDELVLKFYSLISEAARPEADDEDDIDDEGSDEESDEDSGEPDSEDASDDASDDENQDAYEVGDEEENPEAEALLKKEKGPGDSKASAKKEAADKEARDIERAKRRQARGPELASAEQDIDAFRASLHPSEVDQEGNPVFDPIDHEEYLKGIKAGTSDTEKHLKSDEEAKLPKNFKVTLPGDPGGEHHLPSKDWTGEERPGHEDHALGVFEGAHARYHNKAPKVTLPEAGGTSRDYPNLTGKEFMAVKALGDGIKRYNAKVAHLPHPRGLKDPVEIKENNTARKAAFEEEGLQPLLDKVTHSLKKRSLNMPQTTDVWDLMKTSDSIHNKTLKLPLTGWEALAVNAASDIFTHKKTPKYGKNKETQEDKFYDPITLNARLFRVKADRRQRASSNRAKPEKIGGKSVASLQAMGGEGGAYDPKAKGPNSGQSHSDIIDKTHDFFSTHPGIEKIARESLFPHTDKEGKFHDKGHFVKLLETKMRPYEEPILGPDGEPELDEKGRPKTKPATHKIFTNPRYPSSHPNALGLLPIKASSDPERTRQILISALFRKEGDDLVFNTKAKLNQKGKRNNEAIFNESPALKKNMKNGKTIEKMTAAHQNEINSTIQGFLHWIAAHPDLAKDVKAQEALRTFGRPAENRAKGRIEAKDVRDTEQAALNRAHNKMTGPLPDPEHPEYAKQVQERAKHVARYQALHPEGVNAKLPKPGDARIDPRARSKAAKQQAKEAEKVINQQQQAAQAIPEPQAPLVKQSEAPVSTEKQAALDQIKVMKAADAAKHAEELADLKAYATDAAMHERAKATHPLHGQYRQKMARWSKLTSEKWHGPEPEAPAPKPPKPAPAPAPASTPNILDAGSQPPLPVVDPTTHHTESNNLAHRILGSSLVEVHRFIGRIETILRKD